MAVRKIHNFIIQLLYKKMLIVFIYVPRNGIFTKAYLFFFGGWKHIYYSIYSIYIRYEVNEHKGEIAGIFT